MNEKDGVTISEEEKMEIPFPCEFQDSENYYVLTHFLEEVAQYSDPESLEQLLYQRFNNYEGYSRTRVRYVVPVSAREINRIGSVINSLGDLMGSNGVLVNQTIANLEVAFKDLANGYKAVGGIGKIKDFSEGKEAR